MNDTKSLNISQDKKKISERIIGKGNESEIYIASVKIKALIDTGSMVSTIAEKFLFELNNSRVIYYIDELGLRINTTIGQSMPQSGVVGVNKIIHSFGN